MELILALDAVAVLLLVGTALVKGFHQALGLAACLLLVFPDQGRLQIPGLFDLTPQRVIVLCLGALYFTMGRRSHPEGDAPPLRLGYLLMALIGWMLLSSANSVVPMISFKSTLSQSLDFCLIFFIYARSLRSEETRDKVLAGLVSGGILCSVLGVIEVYAGWKVTSLFPAIVDRFAGLDSVDSRGARVQSSFDHAILFGAALAMAIPLALYLATRTRETGKKVLLWVGVGLMLLCLYKTNSRGPWLACLLAFAVLLVLGSKAVRASLMLLMTAALLVVLVRPGIRASIVSLYGATLDPDSPQGESYQWRYTLYDIAGRELSKSLPRALWGYGPESFYYLGLTADFAVEGQMHTVKVESCDSAVVEIMMDTGYIGLLLISSLLGSSAWFGLGRYRASSQPNASAYAALLAALAAFCFLMTNVEIFGWGQQSYMLWIVLALLVTPLPLLAGRDRLSAGPSAAVIPFPAPLGTQTFPHGASGSYAGAAVPARSGFMPQPAHEYLPAQRLARPASRPKVERA